MNTDIASLVKEKLAAELRNDGPRDNSYIHASQVAECRRKQGYAMLNVEPLPHSNNLLHVFDLGNAVHKQLQDRLVKMGWCLPKNIELKLHDPDLKVGGTCDALTEPLFGGGRFIIDIKTITAKPRVHYTPDGELWSVDKSSYDHLGKPKPNHLMQVNLYSWLWATQEGQLGWGIPGIFPDIMLIYVAKDTGWEHTDLPYKVFVQPYDPDLLELTLKRATYIHKKIANNDLPAKDFYFSERNRTWQCSSCSYRNTCLPQFFDQEGKCLI